MRIYEGYFTKLDGTRDGNFSVGAASKEKAFYELRADYPKMRIFIVYSRLRKKEEK